MITDTLTYLLRFSRNKVIRMELFLTLEEVQQLLN